MAMYYENICCLALLKRLPLSSLILVPPPKHLYSVPTLPSPVIPPVQAIVIVPECLPETKEFGKRE